MSPTPSLCHSRVIRCPAIINGTSQWEYYADGSGSEPTIFGVHNLNMVYELVKLFNKLYGVVLNKCMEGEINKFDTNIENTEKIEQYCEEKSLAYMGRIPYDINAVKAINKGLTIVDIDCISGNAVKAVYNKTIELLLNKTLTY